MYQFSNLFALVFKPKMLWNKFPGFREKINNKLECWPYFKQGLTVPLNPVKPHQVACAHRYQSSNLRFLWETHGSWWKKNWHIEMTYFIIIQAPTLNGFLPSTKFHRNPFSGFSVILLTKTHKPTKETNGTWWKYNLHDRGTVS